MRCVFDYIDAECPTPEEIGACYRCQYPNEDCDAVSKVFIPGTEPIYCEDEDE